MTKKENKKIRIRKKSNYKLNAILGTALIVILGIAMLFALNLLFPFRRGFRMQGLTDYFVIRTLFALLMFGLSLVLTYIYLKDYLELKSRFTLAILFAIISFLMYSITSLPYIHMFFGVRGSDLGVFSIIPMFFATIALAILAWVSNK